MIFVKNSRGGREVNMINTLSKINLSKIGWQGGRSTSIWIMTLNILLLFFESTPQCINTSLSAPAVLTYRQNSRLGMSITGIGLVLTKFLNQDQSSSWSLIESIFALNKVFSKTLDLGLEIQGRIFKSRQVLVLVSKEISGLA